MDLRGDKPLFFATDLTNFIGCRHLTVLERLAAHKLAKRPFFDDPMFRARFSSPRSLRVLSDARSALNRDGMRRPLSQTEQIVCRF